MSKYITSVFRSLLPAVAVVAVMAGLVPFDSRTDRVGVGTPSLAAQQSPPGYWMADSAGRIWQVSATNYGDLRGVALERPVVAGATAPGGLGYWMVGSDGGVFSYGEAGFHGSTGGIHLTRPVVGMAADAATGGYWLVASDGGVFNYAAPFRGSTGGVHLAEPVVGMAATPDGQGYWLVASDGGVFSFGDARFYGSTGGHRLDQPVVGMAATPDGRGYWLVAADGGIFNFGDAGMYGSTGGDRLTRPVVGMAATPDGRGYWLAAADGGIFSFGDAPFLGTTGAPPGSPPVVAVFSSPHGSLYPPGGTGYDISQWQCPQNGGSFPPGPHAVGVVQVSGGAINSYPNPCYQQEAAWAGPNMSAYIFLDELPATVPNYASTGCYGNIGCESYAYGTFWARQWVAYSHQMGIYPSVWWLDVELGHWADRPQASNSALIEGAVTGLKSMGVLPGIYSTAYQWGVITGNQPSLPNIALWVPGAGTVGSAATMCTHPDPYHAPFAGGRTVLIQYGYDGNYHPFDQDFACP